MKRPIHRQLATLMIAMALAAPLPLASGQYAVASGISSDVEIARLLDEIEAGSARQTRVTSELEGMSSQRKELRQNLKLRVRALYRMTRAGTAPVSGGFNAVLRHVARVKRLRRIVNHDARRASQVSEKARGLRSEAGQIAKTLEKARGRLASLQNAPPRRSGPDNFHSVLASPGKGPYQQPNDAQFYGMRLVDEQPVQRFARGRGNLAMPVAGEVRVLDAQRDESDGPGLEFQVPTGTPVRAVEAGRVAFSDRYGSYGRLVILDHGEGFYTVYGGLGGVEVRVGDDVSRRARIGSVGSDLNPSALFFEVRKGTRTLPPRSWLGL